MGLAAEHPIVAERRLEALRHALGPVALEALTAPDVIEIMANPDGKLVLDRLGSGRADTRVVLSPEARERVVRLIADYVGEEVRREDPRIAGVLPQTGERFQGVLPPITRAAAFSIRKRPGVIFTLRDYHEKGILTGFQVERLQRAATTRENILIAGGTSSGKTTLANAVLAESAFANDRVILIEDVPELQCSAWDQVACLTRQQPFAIGVADLVRDALRLRPDRIIVGEIRDGSAALETLKAWNTGHPGGLSTIHANSAEDCLCRLQDLISEVATPSVRAIRRAIGLIVHLRRSGEERLTEIVDITQAGPA